jgi:hypothetical protein
VTYLIGMTPSGELRRPTADRHPDAMDERPRAPHASSDVQPPDRAGPARARRGPRDLARRGLLALTGASLLLIASAVSATIAAAAEPNFPAKDSRYHNYPEMVAEIKAVAAAHPDIVRLFSIGKSYEGRDLWAAKISDNPNADEHEPEVLFDALHHAREHMTVEQALYLYRMLANDYSKYTTIRNLVNNEEIFIIFAMNPDGFRYDLTGSPYRAWRKNRQPNPGSTAVGTDLNRNYDYRFGCCGGSSGNPASITYRGSKPFSAPETQAFRKFVDGRVENGIQQLTEHITLHTNGELILWPFGYTKTDIPGDMTKGDWTTFVKLGRGMAARNGYTPQQSSDLYITDGDQIDWLYGKHRIFSFTWELYPTETPTVWGDHYPADEHIASQTARNRSALIWFLQQAGCPYQAAGLAIPNCGAFFDDAEGSKGWAADPDGTDSATTGRWGRADPAQTTSNGVKQLGTTVSGSRAFVTGGGAGSSPEELDLDGVSTLRSTTIDVPAKPGRLTFSWYLAHDASSTAEDQLRLAIETEGGERTLLWHVDGDAVDRDAVWQQAWLDVSAYAGQTIRLVFQAEDGGADNLVEAALDDIRIRRPG